MHCTIAFLALVPTPRGWFGTREDGCNHNPMQHPGLAARTLHLTSSELLKSKQPFQPRKG
jgi:hypothetical protein